MSTLREIARKYEILYNATDKIAVSTSRIDARRRELRAKQRRILIMFDSILAGYQRKLSSDARANSNKQAPNLTRNMRPDHSVDHVTNINICSDANFCGNCRTSIIVKRVDQKHGSRVTYPEGTGDVSDSGELCVNCWNITCKIA